MNPVWECMWVAPLPILLLAAYSASWHLSAIAAALSMFLGSLTMLYYLHFVLRGPVMAWIIPFSAVSLLFMGGVLLFRALLRRKHGFAALVSLPALWTLNEYVTSLYLANGTAGSLAYTQVGNLPILQLASVTGPWGITFLLLLVPSAIAAVVYLWRKARVQSFGIAATTIAILTGVTLFGTLRLRAPVGGERIRVGLLDTDQVELADADSVMQTLMQSYAVQAERLIEQGARIIVMPEKIGILSGGNESAIDSPLQAIADRTKATLVVGVVHVFQKKSSNEARIYTPRHPVVTYAKEHLLPPFESKLVPGNSLTMLPQLGAPIGVAICKDMDFIRPALDYGHARAALLLDPAWDFGVDRAWHGHIAIMRGVENGYGIAHTAKDGFLTATDDRGRILGEVRSDVTTFAALLIDLPSHHEETIFDRYGNWFPYLAGLMLLAAVAQLAGLSRASV